MELENRIHYDANELIQRIEVSLDRLKPYQYDTKYREMFGSYLVDKLSQWDRNIRQRKNDPFTLVICGDFKRGKSSLLNALLEEDICPVNVTTETVTLNRIAFGAHSNEAVLSGGRRMMLSDEELCRDCLEDIMERVGEPIIRMELKRPIEILKQITIMDTPGLGDSERDFSSEVEQSLQQADAVIYVFSAAFPLSRTEQLYLKSSIIPQKYTSLFLVSNFSDMITDKKDYDRVCEMMKSRVMDLLPGQQVHMVSALDERCRQMEEERPNKKMQQILETNFSDFKTEVWKLIQDKCEIVLPDRMQRMLRMMAADIEENLVALEQGLEMDSKDAQQAIEKWRSEKDTQSQMIDSSIKRIATFVETMKGEAFDWMEGLVQRMKSDTDTLDRFSADDLVKYYSLFCVDVLQEALTRCLEWHTEKLMDELDEISQELTRSVSKNHDRTDYNFRFALNNRTWTKGDNVSFIASKFSSGVLGLAATGIGGMMRKNELQDRKPQVIEAIKQQYDALFVSVQKEITKAYKTLEDRAVQAMQEYYSDKLCALEQQVEQSAMVARQDNEKKEEIRQAIHSLQKLIDDLVIV